MQNLARYIIRPLFGRRFPPFSLSPPTGNAQAFTPHFCSADPHDPPAFNPIYLFDPAFFLFYTLPSLKQVRIIFYEEESHP